MSSNFSPIPNIRNVEAFSPPEKTLSDIDSPKSGSSAFDSRTTSSSPTSPTSRSTRSSTSSETTLQRPTLLSPSQNKLSPEQIFDLFNNREVSAACALENHTFTPTRNFKTFAGGIAGFCLGELFETTGPGTALHEIVGHGLLGFRMTNNYQSGQGPSYSVQGWDNLKAMIDADSFKAGISDFWSWISGDTHGNDFDGKTWPGNPEGPNALGQAMGSDGQQAWISITGSLPMLALDTIAAVGGMLLRKRRPFIGSMLAATAITDAMSNDAYPLGATVMSSSQLQRQAQSGNDFANFAIHIGNMLGVSANAVAIATAAIWTPIVPLAALAAYLYSESHASDIIPDALAVKRWLQKARDNEEIAKELERIFDKYPKAKKATIINNCTKVLAGIDLDPDKTKKLQDSIVDFTAHLVENLPKKILQKEKAELLEEWGKHIKPDRLQTAFTTISIAGSISAIATKILQVFSETIAPSLSTALTALTYVSPFLIGASVLSTGYQVYKDFKCSDDTVPLNAKRLSIARLVVSIASAVLITAALFVPGLNVVLIAAIVLGSLINIILAFARFQIIQQKYALKMANNPDVFPVMKKLWQDHQAKLELAKKNLDPKDLSSDRKKAKPPMPEMSRTLKQWIACVKEHPDTWGKVKETSEAIAPHLQDAEARVI